MSEIRVNKIQGTSGTDTAITLSGANATVGGTLAVTGVHTIGNNAVVTSDGGAVTSNLAQGQVKQWVRTSTASVTVADSFNTASVTDSGVGLYAPQFTNNMGNTNYCISCIGDYDGGSSVSPAGSATEHDNNSTSAYQFQSFRLSDDAYTDVQKAPAMIVGDLA